MPETSSASLRILIVDDEAEMRDSLKAFLRSELSDLEIHTASEPTEALDVLEDHDIDLVLSDHRMPGMRGLEFLRRVGKRSPGTTRWLMTGLPGVDLAKRALDEGGVDRFITKPMDPDEVVVALREVIEDGSGGDG